MQEHQLVGTFVGDTLGIWVGSLLSGVGSRVVGNLVGLGLGNNEGLSEGSVVVGSFEGFGVGKTEGIKLGDGVGCVDGMGDGIEVGKTVGDGDGLRLGLLVGVALGFLVGFLVGSSENIQLTVILCFPMYEKLAPLNTSHSSSSPNLGSSPISEFSFK